MREEKMARRIENTQNWMKGNPLGKRKTGGRQGGRPPLPFSYERIFMEHGKKKV